MTRALPLFALAALSACAPGELTFDDTLTFSDELLPADLEALPPPGVPLTITATVASPGLPITINVGSADPFESIRLLRSTVGLGAGPCPPLLGGMCVDVQAPTLMGTFSADAVGSLTLNPVIPPGVLPGTLICLQAVAVRGPGGINSVKSRALCRVAANGSVGQVAGANTADTYDNPVFAGGGLRAMRLDVTVPGVAHYLEVFSGELLGATSISLWSHDPINNEPNAALATGTWSLADNTQWQGAPLNARIPMAVGDTYWVVWQQVSGAQAPRDAVGAMVPYRGSFDGGATWTGPFNGREKFKVCGGGGCP
jgi:hypothetical protein